MIRSKPARIRSSASLRAARTLWAVVAVGGVLTGGPGCCLPDPVDFLASIRCGSTPWSARCTSCGDAGFCGPSGCSTGGCATGNCGTGVGGGYEYAQTGGGNYLAARPAAVSSEAPHEPSPGEVAHQAAVDSMKAGRFEEADAHFAEALRHKPHDANLLCDVGYAQILMGDYPAAEDTLRDALQIAPSNKTAMANLGLAVGAQGRGDEAAAIFRRHRTELAAWVDAGEAAKTGGQFDAARQCFERALEISPQHDTALASLAALPAPTRFAAAPHVAPAAMAELQPLPRSSFGAAPVTEVPLLSPEAAAERIPPRSAPQFPRTAPQVESPRPAVLPSPEDGARKLSPTGKSPRAAETATVPLDPPGPPPRVFQSTASVPTPRSAPELSAVRPDVQSTNANAAVNSRTVAVEAARQASNANAADQAAVRSAAAVESRGTTATQTLPPTSAPSAVESKPHSSAVTVAGFKPQTVGAASREAAQATATRPLPATGAAFVARPAPAIDAAAPIRSVAEPVEAAPIRTVAEQAEAAPIRPTAFEEPAAVLPFVSTAPAATEPAPAAQTPAPAWKPSRSRPVEAKANWSWSNDAKPVVRPNHPLPHPADGNGK